MLGADILFLLERRLDDLNTKDPRQLDRIVEILKSIYLLEEYQQWLSVGQFTKAVTMKGRFSLPSTFGADLGTDKWLLERLGLVEGNLLEVKIDANGSNIYITDGSWVDAQYRVYPFGDESDLICRYLAEAHRDYKPDLLLDPASGCGRHGLALGAIPIKVSLDVNLRALAFCRINALLAGQPQMMTGLNDIRDGFPSLFKMIRCKNALIAINMPFAIFPKIGATSRTLAQDGGDRGAQLTFAALDAVHKLTCEAPSIDDLRCIILFYSLGNAREDKWEVVERARSLFGPGQVSHAIFSKETMWRVNGRKEQPNPMPLDRLELKADCRHTFEEEDAAKVREGYQSLQDLYASNGFTHLAYGLADIRCK